MKRFSSIAMTFALFLTATAAAEERLKLQHGDHISYIGNTLADRMQHHAWLETYIHALHPEHELAFRNLSFPGDELTTRPRSQNFGSPDEWLTKTQADVVFCFFGYNEALRGEGALGKFEKDLAGMIDQMRSQKYNGERAPRLVMFSPIAHENLNNPNLPDGSENNQKLELYTTAMQRICASKEVLFVDLFTPSQRLYEQHDEPLTLNGIHLLDRGNKLLAQETIPQLFKEVKIDKTPAEIERLRQAVLDKNYHWFSRYRVVDGYNVYGGRSKLAWHGQSNADVMAREMEIFDVKTANRDKRIWAVAGGSDLKVTDENLPPLLEVKTNKPGKLEGGAYPYIEGDKAIEKMHVHEGMKINLFASEDMFPRLVNPVQMAVDTDSRLWASVWPSYPHWNPTQPRKDALVILPDENRDGVADDCIVFADELNSITGFEFWGGGVLVAAPPEIWFLKDTDGDDKADVKIRMLQGVSSADTHHTANAMVIGPDGGLYWSRGVFHVTNMETPTKTFRSTSSGVYRFDPRTFEIDFHFPIGPNPHGDVFDRWGYQFANDGTSGTGSYVNIGHGVGNKHWFKKRVRPVAATGLLSSSHFPERFQGNFLICNVIGFLGVLQHEVKYNGADITAEEIDPIVYSDDPNFRPSDLEVGGDGALYISDWHNALIGHMQHNMRDPNRDDTHGRIYRVTYKGRELLEPPKMKGKPIEEVCQHFFALENGTRYRARLELSGRETPEVVAKVGDWAAKLNPQHDSKQRDEAQALLECLWVFEEHRVPNQELLKRVLQAAEPRVRAAAIRTLGHWGEQIPDWEPILAAAARDESALVRAEAVKAALSFDGLPAAEVVFQVAARPTDPELDAVLKYARGKLNLDKIVQDALKSGEKLSLEAQQYTLRNASVEDLLKMERSEAVYQAILNRSNVPQQQLSNALTELAKMRQKQPIDLLLRLIEERDAEGQTATVPDLGELLAAQPADQLGQVEQRLRELAKTGNTAETRRAGYAAWITAQGSADDALTLASAGKQRLGDFLEAIPLIASEEVRRGMFRQVRPLLSKLPGDLQSAGDGSAIAASGIEVEYFKPNPKTAKLEAFAKLKPKASATVPKIQFDVPVLQSRDAFALKFSGGIQIERSGKYTFYTNSDDGSCLYIGDQLVVNNDGLHGMSEKRGTINLTAGIHPIIVTYFDNGGGDGLVVSWSGPGFKKQQIPASKLVVQGNETLHDLAIRSLSAIPGYESEKFQELAGLILEGRHQVSAVQAIQQIPQEKWDQQQFAPLAANLAKYVSEIPAKYRTQPTALATMKLIDTLASKLPAEAGQQLRSQLADLKVHVIRIGTVPHRMIYDKEKMTVQAGKPVEFVFSNTDSMPHNFAVAVPGSLEEVGLLAEATARDKDAMARHYIPKTNKILVASRLLQPNETQAISFVAPEQPGIYPYVCTYPGHWRRMYGALYVVENLKAYEANPEEYLASHSLPIKDELLEYNTRNTEWKYEDLVSEVEHLHGGRSFEVGKQLFKVASCVACHRLNNEGQAFGPDLAKLDPKFKAKDILQELIDPSKRINEKYYSYTFILTSGKVVTGLIVEDQPKFVKVVQNPLDQKGAIEILKSEIDEKIQAKKSLMPEGLLNRLKKAEILDLIAYLVARGDKKHKLFDKDHKH